ncbi:large ribosomal subunit protein bL19cz-like [Curcuma longa]|uniref:large ribosomal subunit protein bL19cz-like n=1 Tax=Curcuma longa TaxID=136217 RepID=UPI003D9EDF8F
MASAALLRPLFSLPSTAPRSATPSLSLSSSSLPSFLVAPPLTFGSVAIQRSRGTAAVVVRAASSEEEETSADIDTDDVEEEEVSEVVEADEKLSRKPRVKLGDIMGILNKRAIEASVLERPVPDIRTGDVVEIKLEVPENRRRLSIYKGIVISKQNAGVHTTIRIRRIIAGVGVEIVFPVYSPNIKEIKVVSHRKVRRARLYYLRDKLPRLSTFK